METEWTEFFITDIDEFVKNNKVTDVRQGKDGIIIETDKGLLYFINLTMREYKASHCSCVNIKTTHYSSVASILRTLCTKSDSVWFFDDNVD